MNRADVEFVESEVSRIVRPYINYLPNGADTLAARLSSAHTAILMFSNANPRNEIAVSWALQIGDMIEDSQKG